MKNPPGSAQLLLIPTALLQQISKSVLQYVMKVRSFRTTSAASYSDILVHTGSSTVMVQYSERSCLQTIAEQMRQNHEKRGTLLFRLTATKMRAPCRG
ncbi:uncharacterized protein LAESUDRAFT_322612 [Laetiporus sulphureus 93-53]|uniref:Uncharacterized protein n=1 Tax=Laetiporus sulphureus 93-53 TaxID=1314785 RepID=A0A165D257_9APHY|nr:uncharacterized protein LAESUDRAFT_322612 [Laetiporus sulphureus 93-53]KZT04005.1 hypothetical protein LAESUDRAFT_322612 [Laetiporus sulphureus 93-53]